MYSTLIRLAARSAALSSGSSAASLASIEVYETEQLLPSTNSYYDVATNEDGSIDIWFGPKQPEHVADTNFIQTVPGRNFMAILRLYGAELPFYDQTWKPDDLVRVE